MATDPEKLALLENDSITPTRHSRKRSLLRCLLPSLALFGFVYLQIAATTSGGGAAAQSRCDQVDPYVPEPNDSLDRNRDVIFSEDFREKSAGVLSGFVQVRSPSFDDLGKVGEDERWNAFYEVSKYLNSTFPEVYETLDVERINTHAHVLTWKGTDPSLKPTLLAGHLDVVPVEPATLDDWTYPPFSGHYDGEYLWGRGSVDDKHAVSAILESLTLLIKKGFTPRRTLVLAFGFDEESKGREGAGHIQKHLQERYGKDGVAVIVDEGGLGVGEPFGANMAIVATGEKGYVDVKFTLTTPGGHSSIPPDHTSIGIISQLVTSLEANPFKPSLPLDSPVLSLLSCAAEYGQLPKSLKRDVRRGASSSKKGETARANAAKGFSSMGRGPRYLVSTSQAVDVIKGGVKVNALPESVEVTANYRVAIGSEIQDVKDHVTKLVHSLADQFNLSVDLFGSKRSSSARVGSEEVGFTSAGESGSIKVVSINELPVAPVSPTTGSKAWDILSGTIKHTLNRSKGELIVSPGVMTGNTDTRYYWNVTRNIFRFTPMNREKSLYLHTVDERLWFNDHIDAIWFFHELVRSYDEAEL